MFRRIFLYVSAVSMTSKSWLLMSGLMASSLVALTPAVAETWSQLATSSAPNSSDGFKTTNYDSTNNRLIVYLPEGPSVASQVWVLANANGLGGAVTWTQLQPTGTA